jgi:hypothetical protein
VAANNLEELLSLAARRESSERIMAISTRLLGSPYLHNPAGDGEESEFDCRPISNIREFDCVTFVETVLALAGACDAEDYQRRLRDLRYADGIPSFPTRNHLVDADWLLNNIAKGLLEDVTAIVAKPVPLRYTEYSVLRDSWIRAMSVARIRSGNLDFVSRWRKLIKLQEMMPRSESWVGVEYLPIESAVVLNQDNGREMLNPVLSRNLESGTVIAIVSGELNHIGFFIKHHQRVIFRHASSVRNCVVDADFVKYFVALYRLRFAEGIIMLRPNFLDA